MKTIRVVEKPAVVIWSNPDDAHVLVPTLSLKTRKNGAPKVYLLLEEWGTRRSERNSLNRSTVLVRSHDKYFVVIKGRAKIEEGSPPYLEFSREGNF